jgi:hypothetical protein
MLLKFIFLNLYYILFFKKQGVLLMGKDVDNNLNGHQSQQKTDTDLAVFTETGCIERLAEYGDIPWLAANGYRYWLAANGYCLWLADNGHQDWLADHGNIY